MDGPRNENAASGGEPGAARGQSNSEPGHSTAPHGQWADYYHSLRFSLCAIPPGSKRPLLEDWPNNPRPASHWAATPTDGMGAIMGLSGLVSLDLDALPESRALFAELGIDLDELIADAWIVRGNPARLRAEFRAPAGLALALHKLSWPPRDPSKPKDHPDGKKITVFELRAGPVQDVLPPTIHPDTRRPYEWVRGPRDGPMGELPAVLLELWRNWDAWKLALEAMCPWAPKADEPKTAPRGPGSGLSVIAAFNQAHDVRALLEAHGYKQRGKRFLAPDSSSKLPGVVALGSGRVYSHHGSDPLATGHALDAFEVFNLLDHGGDARAAVKEAARLLGMDHATTAGSQAHGAAVADSLRGAPQGAPEPAAIAPGDLPPSPDALELDDEARKLRAALAVIPESAKLKGHSAPLLIARALKHTLSGIDEPVGAALCWEYDQRNGSDSLILFGKADANYCETQPITTASIFAMAREHGWTGAPAEGPWPDPTPLPARGATGEAPPFPLALLPGPIQAAAREVARFVKAPEAAPGLVGLAALAVAIGKRAKVEELPGLTHYAAIFLAGIAGSGERKSAVFKPMTAPLEDWTADQASAWESATRKAKARNTAIDAALSDAKNRSKKQGWESAAKTIEELEAERLPMPVHPRLFTSDATEQRLFQMIHERGGAFAVLSGEGRPVIDAIAGKYSGDGRTGDAIYLAGISGDTITRDRVGGEAGPEDRVIRDPCLTVCILVQPDKYLDAAQHPALRASGALARIWPVWLPSMAGRRLEGPGENGLDRGAMDPYAALVRRILNHNTPLDPQGQPTPHLATLSPAAAEARRLYHNAVEGMLGEGGELADVQDIAAKAVSQTVKLALVLHLAAHPEALDNAGSVIDGETWQDAQAVGAWFLAESVRVQRQADEDPALEGARRVLRWLATERRETLTGRDLQREGPRPRPNAKVAAAVLDTLAVHGYLRQQGAPGTRTPVYQVHPALSVASVAAVARADGENPRPEMDSGAQSLATMATNQPRRGTWQRSWTCAPILGYRPPMPGLVSLWLNWPP